VRFENAAPKRDADEFLTNWTDRIKPRTIYLDAPLSLPGIYRGLPGFTDYFYRRADREAGAMSPMFLGGLTARAMKLKAELESRHGLRVCEAYPGGLARELELAQYFYKKKEGEPGQIAEKLAGAFDLELIPPDLPWNWHLVDALLCLCIGLRERKGKHRLLGDPVEGCILV